MARLALIAGVLGLSIGMTSVAQAAVLPVATEDMAAIAGRTVLDGRANSGADVQLAHRGCYYGPGYSYGRGYYGGGYYRPYYRSYYRPYSYYPGYWGGYGGGYDYGPRVGFYITF